ncbi:histone-lysine N-methyltransferase H3 lysine-79 specific-like isoform X1 [Tripterygium wilfordii]|uniref:Histone-lysine N-methyltransferase H3 lysine-79 specific-like isoform X1 n=1 Tax=Tripterygium wilfordii TaxID=458696 RepID=A0A7J7E1N3_TRIWF|nr:histone-lysine N-methyltransferase H3 lysine-79 specific-like isoform X1 [Tripterygium wilfordii]
MPNNLQFLNLFFLLVFGGGIGIGGSMMPPRRKKWTEAEEKTLIDKYGEMVSDGTLAKMKTREKKFKPIAHHVNSVHHLRDPIGYPWLWTWKDVSTKVQNMRHQYLLVKQKIKRPDFPVDDCGVDSSVDEFDWVEGLTHWSNFLRYKEVFGDVPFAYNSNTNDSAVIANEDRQNDGGLVTGGRALEMVQFEPMGHSGDGDFVGMDGCENGVLGLRFEYDAEEAEENFNGNNQMREESEDGYVYEDVDPNGANMKKKRKALKGLEKKTFGFLVNQLAHFRDMEARYEHRDTQREREMHRMENIRMERELEWERKYEERENKREERGKTREKLRRQRVQEWEALERESEERERRRHEEALNQERECEENMNRQRLGWKKRIDDMLGQHRAEMGQIQTRILHEQQNLNSQLLGIVSQWTAHPTGLSDHTGASNHYLSQMMQNLHHGMVHGDTRVDGDTQDSHFIVDG